jgi:hypothetical protein
MLLVLATLSTRFSAINSDEATDSWMTSDPAPTAEGGGIPRNVTLIVLVILFAFGVTITVGLCCIKRAKIGKVSDLSTQRFESLEDMRAYTEALPASQEFGPLIHVGPLMDGNT